MHPPYVQHGKNHSSDLSSHFDITVSVAAWCKHILLIWHIQNFHWTFQWNCLGKYLKHRIGPVGLPTVPASKWKFKQDSKLHLAEISFLIWRVYHQAEMSYQQIFHTKVQIFKLFSWKASHFPTLSHMKACTLRISLTYQSLKYFTFPKYLSAKKRALFFSCTCSCLYICFFCWCFMKKIWFLQ